jgi:hypothetical protein
LSHVLCPLFKPGSVSCEDVITDQPLEHAQTVCCNDITGVVLSNFSSNFVVDDQITDACKEAYIGINVAMSYASDDPKSPASKDHTPVSSMLSMTLPIYIYFLKCLSTFFIFLFSSGQSTIDKRKRKKRYVKKPCDS